MIAPFFRRSYQAFYGAVIQAKPAPIVQGSPDRVLPDKPTAALGAEPQEIAPVRIGYQARSICAYCKDDLGKLSCAPAWHGKISHGQCRHCRIAQTFEEVILPGVRARARAKARQIQRRAAA